jgi:hypothetical protein
MMSLPGVCAPTGFFDPLGFCNSPTFTVSEAKRFREAEVTHGRVSMLAALGWLVAEEYHPFFGGEIGGPAFRHFQVRRGAGAQRPHVFVAPRARAPRRSAGADRRAAPAPARCPSRRSRRSCRRCAPRRARARSGAAVGSLKSEHKVQPRRRLGRTPRAAAARLVRARAPARGCRARRGAARRGAARARAHARGAGRLRPTDGRKQT